MRLNDLREWLECIVEPITSEAVYFVGNYVETEENRDKHLIAVKGTGGTTRAPFIRYNRYRVIILSPQKLMQPVDEDGNDIDYSGDGPSLFTSPQKTTWDLSEEIAEAIELATDKSLPDCASGIRLLGNKSGPLYTTDDRIYFTLDLEIIK